MSLYKQAYEIRNNILNTMTNNLAKIEGSYNYDIATSVAQELETTYKDVRELWVELFPWSCTKDPYLTYHMTTYGLKRKGATYAKGNVEFTGEVGTIIPKNSIVISRTSVNYRTIESAIINVDGKVTVNIVCEVPDVVGNCGIGDIVDFEMSLVGVKRVTNLNQISGGASIESLESCKQRMQEKASLPAHSGNKNDYIKYLREIPSVGKITVVGAGEHGVQAGNVEIYIGTEEGAIPSSELIKQAQNYIDDDRKPIGANVKVKPYEALTTNFVINEVQVVRGTISKEDYINQLKRNIALAYNTQGFLVNNIIPVSKLITLSYGVNEGVLLIDNLTVNGSQANIRLNYNQLPVVGDISITRFEEV